MSILTAFPPDWRCDVTVQRGGGRNSDGDPVPGSTHVVSGCLVAPRATRDPVDRSEVADSSAVLYAPPRADIVSTDTITVPDDHYMSGMYAADGDPGRWPFGTEVALRRL